MTGNECRNWKASTLKRHAHSADHKHFKYPNLSMSEVQLMKSFYFVNRPKPTIDNK